MKLDTQLLRWSETSNGGFTITLLCADEDTAREYFRDKTLRKGKQAGQLFSMALEELDEPGNEPAPVPRRLAGGPICQRLVLWCDDVLFQEWCGATNKHAAAVWIKETMGVESRKQIDGNNELEKKFHREIRIPFQEWLNSAQRVAA